MMVRIAVGAVAVVLLALGGLGAANKAGLFGPTKPPTVLEIGGSGRITLPPVWHADTGEFTELRDGVCRTLGDTATCAAYFIKGLGTPRAVAIVASGREPAQGPGGLLGALGGGGAAVSGPQPVAGIAGAQRYESKFKRRGRYASTALTDAIPLGGELLMLQVVAEEPEGRYQAHLLAEIEASLQKTTARP